MTPFSHLPPPGITYLASGNLLNAEDHQQQRRLGACVKINNGFVGTLSRADDQQDSWPIDS